MNMRRGTQRLLILFLIPWCLFWGTALYLSATGSARWANETDARMSALEKSYTKFGQARFNDALHMRDELYEERGRSAIFLVSGIAGALFLYFGGWWIADGFRPSRDERSTASA